MKWIVFNKKEVLYYIQKSKSQNNFISAKIIYDGSDKFIPISMHSRQ